MSSIERNHPEDIMRDLSGKTAIVVGASRGLGRATATALAEAGAKWDLSGWCRCQTTRASSSNASATREAGGTSVPRS